MQVSVAWEELAIRGLCKGKELPAREQKGLGERPRLQLGPEIYTREERPGIGHIAQSFKVLMTPYF